MLSNTIDLTMDAGTVTVTRVNQDQFGSTYFGESGDSKITLTVKHTIPARGMPGESHMVRLDVEHYTNAGEYLRTSSAWIVIKTFDGIQDSTASKDVADALSVLSDPTLVESLVARES